MAAGRLRTTSFSFLLLAALVALPASADAQRRREGSDNRSAPREERAERQRERAVPRAGVNDRNEQRQREASNEQQQREASNEQQQRASNEQRQREAEARRQAEVNGQRNQWRDNDRARGNDDRWRNEGRVYGRPLYSYHPPRTVIVPRVVRPRIVTVVPYRPYVYRPRLGFDAYYGAGGVYPYGYTPRGYYDPIPGRIYGGLRITDAPHEAQVFADGYYVGIVDDFDGVFQHLNLEVGPHRIEVRLPGYDDAIAFDVVIQPGRTITYRADWY